MHESLLKYLAKDTEILDIALCIAISAAIEFPDKQHSRDTVKAFKAALADLQKAREGAQRALNSQHCINCGASIDPNCNCEKGRGALPKLVQSWTPCAVALPELERLVEVRSANSPQTFRAKRTKSPRGKTIWRFDGSWGMPFATMPSDTWRYVDPVPAPSAPIDRTWTPCAVALPEQGRLVAVLPVNGGSPYRARMDRNGVGQNMWRCHDTRDVSLSVLSSDSWRYLEC